MRGLRRLGRVVLAFAIAMLVRVWIASLRYRRQGPAFVGPGLVAFWHGDQLPLIGQRPSTRSVAPVSLSRDGRLQAKILGHLGIVDVPGSSSRGGAVALRGLWRALRGGAVALMAVDGPRGPRGAVKPGVIHLARRLGLPVWPVGVAVGRGHRLPRSWDKFLLPAPFTQTAVSVGTPLRFDADEALEAAQVRLAEAIVAASDAAQAMMT